MKERPKPEKAKEIKRNGGGKKRQMKSKIERQTLITERRKRETKKEASEHANWNER